MIIDVHAHFYPLRFLEQFESLERYGFEVQRDASGSRHLLRRGKLLTTYTDAFFDIGKRLEKMAQGKVDLQVLSVVQPGITWAEPGLGLDLCAIVNDELHQIVKKYPDHFLAVAYVPLQDVNLAVQELVRAVRQLGCRGVGVGTNVNGQDLDHPDLFPFYEKVEELGVPVFLHPFAMEGDYARLAPYFLEGGPVGFMFDNIIAISKLIFGGILEKYPRIKFLFPHLGGGVPYLIARIDKAAEVRPQICRQISRPPSQYLKKVFLDTAYFYGPAVQCALACVPEENILFGTDYPFSIGYSPEEGVAAIRQDSFLAGSLKGKILSENPVRFLQGGAK